MSYDKHAAFDRAILTAQRLCALNDMSYPIIVDDPDLRGYGCYDHGRRTISVCVRSCRTPSRSNYSWTWPGYSADLTVTGVTAHELGHFWHFQYGGRLFKREWRLLTAGESPVTSYGKTQFGEDVAETFKLFVTNPSLLAVLWPRRMELLSSRLKPVENRDWRDVLAGSQRHVDCVERKLERKERRLCKT